MKQKNLLGFKGLLALLKKYQKQLLTAGGFVTGLVIIFIVLSLLMGMLFRSGLTTVASALTLLIYGSVSSTLWVGLLEILAGLGLTFVLEVLAYYFTVAIQFQLQDVIAGKLTSISFTSVWQQFRFLNKNQVLRLLLYNGLFLFFWQLPLLILEYLLGSNQIILDAILIIWLLVMIWKNLEYSQSLFLYREQQPAFLGQSQRHALTASRRFFTQKRVEIWELFITLAIPAIIWAVVWGVVTYYGFYFWEPIMIYGGPIVGILGACFYLPVILAALAAFYQRNRSESLVQKVFQGLFVPVEKLTGQLTNEK